MLIICTTASRYKQQREYDFYPRTERLRRRDVLQRVLRATRSRRLYKLASSKDIEKRYSHSKRVVLHLLAQKARGG